MPGLILHTKAFAESAMVLAIVATDTWHGKAKTRLDASRKAHSRWC
jgi:hypothetical protein